MAQVQWMVPTFGTQDTRRGFGLHNRKRDSSFCSVLSVPSGNGAVNACRVHNRVEIGGRAMRRVSWLEGGAGDHHSPLVVSAKGG